MARNTTLANLRTQLKAYLGQTLGTANDTTYNTLLSLQQQNEAKLFQYPFLEDRFDLAVPPGSRYLTFPTLDNEGITTALNLEFDVIAEVYWSTIYQPVAYGIGSEQFNLLNSDIPGNAQDPIQNWRWSEENQIEIWPINIQGQTLRFTGQRALDPLVADSDTADLDDQIIVLPVAVELLTRSKQPDAQLRLSKAMELLRAIKSHYPVKQNGLVFGGKEELPRDQVRLISIAGNH
jgi:hypothetical protein